jgi:hypothetical protein
MMVIKLGMVSVPGVRCITRTQFHDACTFYIPDGIGHHVKNHKLRIPMEAKLPDDDNQASPPPAVAAADDDEAAAAAAADDDDDDDYDDVNDDVFVPSPFSGVIFSSDNTDLTLSK